MRRARRSDQGYTLIEVMMAMAVMIVGIVGLLSLQQASTQANYEARQMTTGTHVTQVWLERVRRDALRWNTNTPTGVVLGGTTYLVALPGAGWVTPVPAAAEESYGFGFQGIDTRVEADMVYCTHLRGTWLVPNDTMRVDARTWWHRRGQGTDADQADFRLFPNCGLGVEAGVTDEIAASPSRLRAIHAGTLVRWTPL